MNNNLAKRVSEDSVDKEPKFFYLCRNCDNSETLNYLDEHRSCSICGHLYEPPVRNSS